MSDPDHIEILRSGPRAWNAWRQQNHSILPNLTGVSLKLSERQMGPINGGPINLRSARLQGAFLRFATLSAANLEAADMSDADLTHARLDHADLSFANFSNALLDHADFASAKLSKANFSGASLRNARNLTQGQIYGTIGNGSTILPSHLQRPAAWSQVSKEAISSQRDEAGTSVSKLTR